MLRIKNLPSVISLVVDVIHAFRCQPHDAKIEKKSYQQSGVPHRLLPWRSASIAVGISSLEFRTDCFPYGRIRLLRTDLLNFLVPVSFKTFEEAYKALTEKLQPKVYELGFLKV